jgi:hypothetical protein
MTQLQQVDDERFLDSLATLDGGLEARAALDRWPGRWATPVFPPR